MLLLIFALRSLGHLGVELRELQLTFEDDGKTVVLPALNDAFDCHLYISQAWKQAQDR